MTKFEDDIDRFMARQAQHKPHDSCRGAGDPSYHDSEEYSDPCSHDDFRIRPVVGQEDKYMVTANGRIFAKTRLVARKDGTNAFILKGHWLQGTVNRLGYRHTAMGRKTINWHKIVAQAFIPNTENKPHLNHLDSTPLHNCASNLEWCTPKENVQHSFTYGNAPHGADKPGAKLNWDKVNNIRQKLSEGRSLNQLAKEFNVSQKLILNIKQGKAWRVPF